MLQKNNRLKKGDEIMRLLKAGKTDHGLWLTFKSLPQTEGLKVVVVISSKRFKKAVDRNQLKRRILEAVKNNLPLSTPLQVAILPKKSETLIPFSEILKDILRFKDTLKK